MVPKPHCIQRRNQSTPRRTSWRYLDSSQLFQLWSTKNSEVAFGKDFQEAGGMWAWSCRLVGIYSEKKSEWFSIGISFLVVRAQYHARRKKTKRGYWESRAENSIVRRLASLTTIPHSRSQKASVNGSYVVFQMQGQQGKRPNSGNRVCA